MTFPTNDSHLRLGAEDEKHVEVTATPPPEHKNGRRAKRIIVCCDGTWQDGLVSKKRWQYTNVLKLARMINHEDDRHHPPVPQVIFYQHGVGTDNSLYSEFVDGATGLSLVSKVKEAYAFIANNYHLGDEIYLFGFSRGAYTARMTAALIGEIGVLNKNDMDHFADIFFAYQKSANLSNAKEVADAKAYLGPWRSPNAKGRIRADLDSPNTFTIKCLGVFDTVGSVGLPEELRFNRKIKRLFGFPDTELGAHIKHAFHAMALDERRPDFNVTKFRQTPEGRQKKQELKQVWFTGAHSDIGGGYEAHDLADTTLTWMASNIQSMLSLDLNYLLNVPRPTAPWGAQPPHNSSVGIFRLSSPIHRTLPTETDDITYEYIHASVHEQPSLHPLLTTTITTNPALICPLAPLEELIKTQWPHMKGRHGHGITTLSQEDTGVPEGAMNTLLKRARTAVTVTFRSQSVKEKGEGEGRRSAVHRHSWFLS